MTPDKQTRGSNGFNIVWGCFCVRGWMEAELQQMEVNRNQEFLEEVGHSAEVKHNVTWMRKTSSSEHPAAPGR